MDLVASQGMKVTRTEVNDLLPTPKARDYSAEGYEAGLRRSTPQVGTIVKGIAEKDERVAGKEIKNLLPTPIVRDYKDGNVEVIRNGKVQVDTVGRAIMNSGEILLGTPRTSSANGSTPKQVEAGAPKARIEDQVLITSWGKFEPAIRRWEEVFGRKAPEPTKPDGRDGNHRLSSSFTEWMMGLPENWVCNQGLSRSDELKICGNGVVPAQAELALSMLLRDTGLLKGEQNENM
jgi:DNA (cytosine-5)-methyltransferase 1